MKNSRLPLAAALLAALILPPALRADTETVNGIEWTYTVSDGKASVGYYYEDPLGDAFLTTAVPTSTTGAIAIPSTLDGYPVTRIERGAFKDCSSLTSVTIGDSVTSIGDSAFEGCSNLTSVIIGSSVTSIGGDAFANCNSMLYDTTTIPGVKLVDGWVVGHNSYLPNDLVLNGIRGIGPSAFWGCSGLTSVTIPDSVTHIGSSAFWGCRGLTSVTIPDSVTHIGSSAFWGCRGLTSVTMPDSIKSIGYDAFYGCKGLTQVHIANLRSWCAISFGSEYSNPCKYSHRLVLRGKEIARLAVPSGVTGIGNYAFSGCSGLTSVTLPDSVTSIGDYAFSGCSGLTSVTLPDSVTSIGDYAFSSCNGLASIKVPMSVNSFGTGIFTNCRKLKTISSPKTFPLENQANCPAVIEKRTPDGYIYLHLRGCNWCQISSIPIDSAKIPATLDKKKVTRLISANRRARGDFKIPEGVLAIGDGAFRGCDKMISISIPKSMKEIGANAFGFYDADELDSWEEHCPLEAVYITDLAAWCSIKFHNEYSNPLYIAHRLYLNKKEVKDLSIPSGVTQINDYAFLEADCVKSLKVPNGVTNIGAYAFAYCSLKSVTLPKGLVSIGSHALDCARLASLSIPASVTDIGEHSWSWWERLKEIVLPVRFKGKTEPLGLPDGCVIRYNSACTIRFNPNGGSGSMAAMTSKPKKKVTLRANKFKRKGYGFFGWSRKPSGPLAYKNKWQGIPKNGKGKQLVAGETLDLYAFWAKPTYKVAFYANGGKGKMAAQKMTYGKAKKLTANKFKRTGYVFKGWAKSKALAKKGKVAYKNKKAVKNLVTNGKTVKLYAVWKKK